MEKPIRVGIQEGKKRQDYFVVPAYITLALANVEKRDKRTNAARPSLDSVIEAKEWVDKNKL